jgi:hypothetical protein
MTEIALLEPKPITLDRVSIQPRTLIFPEDMPESEWKDFGDKLDLIIDAGPFIIGDWVNWGISNYGATIRSIKGFVDTKNKSKFSEKLKSLTAKTLFNYATVTSKIPREYRVDGVSFAVHQSVSAIVPRKFLSDEHRQQVCEEVRGWLLKAKEHQFTLREMRHALANRSTLSEYLAEPEEESEIIEINESNSKPSTAIEKSLADYAISSQRELNQICHWFEKQAKIKDWSEERKTAVYAQLRPTLEAAEKVSDWYLQLCQ